MYTPPPESVPTEKFIAKKSLGQNFLTSDVVPRWMSEAALITETDTILEIGPGTGVLTKALLAKAGRVIAIETDSRAVALLQNTFFSDIETKKLALIQADIREISLSELGLTAHSYKVVANIPYYLSGFLLRFFLEQKIQPTTLVFLMQKEVVARIVRAKKESILSLSVKAFGSPRYIKTVTSGHFMPQPKVDSAILQVTNITMSNFSDECDVILFFKLLHLGFGQKRKQLLANLSKEYSREALAEIFDRLAITLTIRAEDLNLPTWLKLTEALQKIVPVHSEQNTII